MLQISLLGLLVQFSAVFTVFQISVILYAEFTVNKWWWRLPAFVWFAKITAIKMYNRAEDLVGYYWLTSY